MLNQRNILALLVLVGLVAGETLVLSVAGGILGGVVARLVIHFGAVPIHVGSYSFPVVVSFALMLGAVGGAALVGLLGGILPGIQVSRRPIVDAIRSVD